MEWLKSEAQEMDAVYFKKLYSPSFGTNEQSHENSFLHRWTKLIQLHNIEPGGHGE